MKEDADSLRVSFPHPTLTPITSCPTYQTIADINLDLNANKALVAFKRGDGIYGLLVLSVKMMTIAF